MDSEGISIVKPLQSPRPAQQTANIPRVSEYESCVTNTARASCTVRDFNHIFADFAPQNLATTT